MNIQQLRHRLNISRRYLVASYKSLIDKSEFRNVKTLCLFIGNPRSGHTMVGSLIDAHRSAVIADEMDVAKYLPITPNREHLFWMLQQNSSEAAQAGRVREGYAYDVPNQWQGRYETLSVIGDKKGGRTAWAFGSQPEQYERLRQLVKLPIKFIHVIRNPYDNITTMTQRRQLNELRSMTKGYFDNCSKVMAVKQVVGNEAVLDVKQEDLIAAPQETLEILCQFLRLEPEESYIRDCASILFPSPKLTRNKMPWSQVEITSVARQIEQYEFLQGYRFES